jgi:L-asparagine transporter-like permease
LAPATEHLQKSLSSRHVSMIAFGGIIGAGLFVGSGASIATAGPAIVISYMIAGAIIFMVMRMLSEMASSHPGLGSFTEYARVGLGDWAGFTTGWLYWFFWVIVVGIEAIAGAGIIRQYIDLPLWAVAGGLVIIMTAVNLMSARSFGEFEFWFASVKVAAIIGFIVIAAGSLGLHPPVQGHPFGNLYMHGGFAPKGWVAVMAGVTSVIFALCGAEIATIAAAESKEPDRAVARLTNSVVARILLFYVGSLFLIVAVMPWDEFKPGISPFATVLARIGIPAAAQIMNLVVLTAVLSCLNSGLYVSSRVLYSLGLKGECPLPLIKLGRSGVPTGSILLGALIGFGASLSSIFAPDTIFAFLLNASGATMLMIYLIMAGAQIALRRRLDKQPLADRAVIKMWFFPWLSYITIAAVTAVLVAMAFISDLAIQLYTSILSFAVTLGCFFLFRKKMVPPFGALPAAAVPDIPVQDP